MKNWMRFVVAVGVIAVPTIVAAQSSPADGDEHHHAPSPESIAACKAMNEGDVCEYDGPRGHESGTCHKLRSGDLACFRPHPHHEHDGGTP